MKNAIKFLGLIAIPRVAGSKLLKQTVKCRLQKTIILWIIAILALSMTGCEPEDDKPDPTDNQSIPYGTLPNGVGIYKGNASISDAQMATAVQNAITGYNAAVSSDKNPNGKFTKLVILSEGAGSTWDATTKVLSVGCDAPDSYFRNKFVSIADGSIT
jgi:hypothetical protein